MQLDALACGYSEKLSRAKFIQPLTLNMNKRGVGLELKPKHGKKLTSQSIDFKSQFASKSASHPEAYTYTCTKTDAQTCVHCFRVTTAARTPLQVL